MDTQDLLRVFIAAADPRTPTTLLQVPVRYPWCHLAAPFNADIRVQRQMEKVVDAGRMAHGWMAMKVGLGRGGRDDVVVTITW